MTVSPEMRRVILERLDRVEAEHGVRVLYACESGSRAWNFASPDSDYDVRFIYVRPKDWYLSYDIERRRDVIEEPIVDTIDLSGWDLRKTLYLFTRTNGALLEWLRSPIRYRERGSAAQQLRELAPTAIDMRALCFHYSHMARRNAREYLFCDQVRLKKYFYVLRPLLAIRHIEQGRGIPPVPFEDLVESVAPEALRSAVAGLLALKRASAELGLGAPIPEINDFIEREFERHGAMFVGPGRPDVNECRQVRARLNELFRESLEA